MQFITNCYFEDDTQAILLIILYFDSTWTPLIIVIVYITFYIIFISSTFLSIWSSTTPSTPATTTRINTPAGPTKTTSSANSNKPSSAGGGAVQLSDLQSILSNMQSNYFIQYFHGLLTRLQYRNLNAKIQSIMILIIMLSNWVICRVFCLICKVTTFFQYFHGLLTMYHDFCH